jgi:putative MATE family efflux protein
VAVLGYAVTPALIAFFDAGAAVTALAGPYLRIMFIGQATMYVSVALSASYQAAGDTRTPMLINVAVVLLNAVFDPYFIFAPAQVSVAAIPLGWLGWGPNGAAIAAVVSGVIGCGAFVAISWRSGRPFRRPARAALAIDARLFWHMLRVGAPACVSMIARPLSTFLLLKVIASFGIAAIAAFGIALRSFSVNWILFGGVNTAVSTMVGRALGRHDVRGAERAVWLGMVVDAVIGLGFCFAYYGWSREIILAFDREPAVLAAGVPFLKLMALSFLFSAPMYPLVSAMNGAGDTKPPMIVAFLSNWPVKLPLAYALAVPFGYGVDGVWIGMFVSLVFEALVMMGWYQRGTWKTKRV